MEPEQKFYTFHPERLLPANQYLIMYPEKSYIILLEKGELVEIERLSDLEFAQILILLRNHPYHASLEMLLAAYKWGGEVTDKKIERARRILVDAADCGEYDQALRPLRNLLSRCQLKLHPLGFKISSMPDVGYVLVPHFSRAALVAASKE